MTKEELREKASMLNFLAGKVEGIAWGIENDKVSGALLDLSGLLSTIANEIEEIK